MRASRPFPCHPFLYGALEALLLPLAFAALGLAWWGTSLQAPGAPSPYPAVLMERADTTPERAPERSVWLVDGFNVVQWGLLGGRDRERWWDGSRRALLLARAARFEPPDAVEAAVWIVFDGDVPAAEPESGTRPRVVFAPSADEWLVGRVRRAADPGALVVVTADRRLAARVQRLGARVATPAEFLGRCAPLEERGDFTSI